MKAFKHIVLTTVSPNWPNEGVIQAAQATAGRVATDSVVVNRHRVAAKTVRRQMLWAAFPALAIALVLVIAYLLVPPVAGLADVPEGGLWSAIVIPWLVGSRLILSPVLGQRWASETVGLVRT